MKNYRNRFHFRLVEIEKVKHTETDINTIKTYLFDNIIVFYPSDKTNKNNDK